MKASLQKAARKAGRIKERNTSQKIDKLTASLHLANVIIRTIREPFVMLDEEFRIVIANNSFYRIFKVLHKDTEGKLIFEIGNGQWNIPKLRTLLEEVLPHNNTFDNFEVEHEFPTIGHKVMLLNARKVHQDGEYILLAIADISDSKQLDRRKDDFISIASHELKTPITSINAFVQILQRKLENSTDRNTLYLVNKLSEQIKRLLY